MTFLTVVNAGNAVAQAAASAVSTAKQAQKTPENASVYTMLERRKKKYCIGGKVSADTCLLEPDEIDHVERNLLRMQANALLDREMWLSRMNSARGAWRKATASPFMAAVTYIACFVIIMFIITTMFAIHEMTTDSGKRQFMHQAMYVWAPLVMLSLGAQYI